MVRACALAPVCRTDEQGLLYQITDRSERLLYFWQLNGEDEAVSALQTRSVPERVVFSTCPGPGNGGGPRSLPVMPQCLARYLHPKLLFVAVCKP